MWFRNELSSLTEVSLYCYLWLILLCYIFLHYFINGRFYDKKILFDIKCVLAFSITLSKTFLIRRRIKRNIITIHVQYTGLRTKCPLFLPDCTKTRTFSTEHLKFLISNFMKIRPRGAEFFHADGRTDMTKLIVAVRNFCKASKKNFYSPHSSFVVRGAARPQ